MDELESIDPVKDTTYALMRSAAKRGHATYYLPDGGMILKDGRLFLNVEEVLTRNDSRNPFERKNQLTLTSDDVDFLFIRTDPPFNYNYLVHTWFLDRLTERSVIINEPAGIRTANEKIWAASFPHLTPATLIARNKQMLLDFLDEYKDAIVKPIYGHGGKEIFRLKHGDTNKAVIMETITRNWNRDVILQQFIPEADDGDKRILLLNGEILGAVLRVHKHGEHRNNFFAGGKPAPAEITERDKFMVDTLKPELLRLGLYFVGIDIIGDHLIEVNVTSPTGIQEMDRLYGLHLEDKVIEFAEKKAAERESFRSSSYSVPFP